MKTISIDCINDIKAILAQARSRAYSAVNAAMIEAYWLIGQRIVEEEQHGNKRAGYGEKILQTLSKELTGELGKGFSYANLRNFPQFYSVYPDPEICYTLCNKLTWSHNRLIMRVEEKEACLFYLKESALQNWSVRHLERNIRTFYYQRLLSSKAPQTGLQPMQREKSTANDFIKDPYVFEFLNIAQPAAASEKEIESASINNLQQFILELGKGFSFVAR